MKTIKTGNGKKIEMTVSLNINIPILAYDEKMWMYAPKTLEIVEAEINKQFDSKRKEICEFISKNNKSVDEQTVLL
jgi:broad specificity polyphosphatase/5'/3'-nucleotidase SurE